MPIKMTLKYFVLLVNLDINLTIVILNCKFIFVKRFKIVQNLVRILINVINAKKVLVLVLMTY